LNKDFLHSKKKYISWNQKIQGKKADLAIQWRSREPTPKLKKRRPAQKTRKEVRFVGIYLNFTHSILSGHEEVFIMGRDLFRSNEIVEKFSGLDGREVQRMVFYLLLFIKTA